MGKNKIKVEEQTNGFMVIGTKSILKAKAVLMTHVDDVDEYSFGCATFYKDRDAVWLATDVGLLWDGATDEAGKRRW